MEDAEDYDYYAHFDAEEQRRVRRARAWVTGVTAVVHFIATIVVTAAAFGGAVPTAWSLIPYILLFPLLLLAELLIPIPVPGMLLFVANSLLWGLAISILFVRRRKRPDQW